MDGTLSFIAAILLFILGIPHGATERLGGSNPELSGYAKRPTLSYTVLYIIFGILVFCAWLISAVPTFICFLALSLWHFGQSEPAPFGQAWGWAIGTLIVFGSFACYPNQTLWIFSTLTGSTEALSLTFLQGDSSPHPYRKLTRVLQVAGMITLAALLILGVRGSRDMLARGLALTALFICLPPIEAVAVYFFLIHSLREMGETLDALAERDTNLSNNALKTWISLYAPASLPAIFGMIGVLSAIAAGFISLDIATGLAIAFIIPHMLPIEQLTQAAAGEMGTSRS